MCIYDLMAMKHHLDDDADWWCTPNDEISEINRGNVAFIGLGSDGQYWVEVAESLPNPEMEVFLKFPSGNIFIGAAEEVTSDGLEPECIRGGKFIVIEPGIYKLSAKKAGRIVTLSFSKSDISTNNLTHPIRI